MHTKFWPEKLQRRDHLEGMGVGGRIILAWVLEKQGGKKWTKVMLLTIGISGGFV
jgi:hypothetical protein